MHLKIEESIHCKNKLISSLIILISQIFDFFPSFYKLTKIQFLSARFEFLMVFPFLWNFIFKK